MKISDFDYELPDERIAKFPLGERDASKLLVWRGEEGGDGGEGSSGGNAHGEISETTFSNIASELPHGSLLVFNNTRVVRARLIFRRPSLNAPPDSRHVYAADANVIAAPTPGARIEILCLEPHNPADYERAFAAKNHCEWVCMVGNSKKWKDGAIGIPFEYNGAEHKLQAWRIESASYLPDVRVRFEWDADVTFGQLLELLGRVPIPPYLGRDSAEIDNTRYQTVYSRFEGSVAAPTAGLHFTPELIGQLSADSIEFDEVTLHVGAGTFLPVKAENALDHPMHTERFEVTLATIEHLLSKRGGGQGHERGQGHELDQGREQGPVIAVGTTSVRTLESLTAIAYRISRTGGAQTGSPETETPVGQFEPGDIPETFDGRQALQTLADHMRAKNLQKITAATRIMITPGHKFRIVDGIITNFHQPKSTLLLLVSAFTGSHPGGEEAHNEEWRRIYDHALANDFRFLSYGDSSLLLKR